MVDVFTVENFRNLAIGIGALGVGLKQFMGERKTALATEYGVQKQKIERLEADERAYKEQIQALETKLHDTVSRNRELTSLIRLDTLPAAIGREFEALRELLFANQAVEEIRTIVDSASTDVKEHVNVLVTALRTDLGETLADTKSEILDATKPGPTVKER